jgi:hypothetical protein
MVNSRHHCTPDKVCNCAPSEEELYLLGFEKWQVSIMKKLPPDLQWEAHDEFIRRLMSNDSNEEFRF